MADPYGYIYLLRNKVNGKIYIGKKKGSKVAEWYYGSGVAITNAVNFYGKENFDREILDWADSLETLNDRERYWIAKYNSQNKKIGYNLTSGGDGFAGHHSAETRAKMGRTRKGMRFSEAHKKALSEAAYRRPPISEETRRKISEGHKGIPGCWAGKKREPFLKGRIHITNGVDHKMINPSDFEKYEKEGWWRGMPARKGA